MLAAVVWPAPQPLRNAVLARALETSIASERGLGQIELSSVHRHTSLPRASSLKPLAHDAARACLDSLWIRINSSCCACVSVVSEASREGPQPLD